MNAAGRTGIGMLSCLLTCLLLGTACGKRLTGRNLEQVRAEMSKKEVESVLGQPTRTRSHELTLVTQMKTLPATRYYYEQDGQMVELIFVNDKLVGKSGGFEPDEGTPKRLAEIMNASEISMDPTLRIPNATPLSKETAAELEPETEPATDGL